jgi:ABC-type multidrug transport system fused ATPase/permease subunit
MFGRKKEKSEKVKITKDSIKKAKSIFLYLKPYRMYFAIGWLFLVLSSSAGLVFPYLMGQLLGGAGSSNSISSASTGSKLSLENVNMVAFNLPILE